MGWSMGEDRWEMESCRGLAQGEAGLKAVCYPVAGSYLVAAQFGLVRR